MPTKEKSRTDRKRDRARQLLSAGKSVNEIAEELGVAANTARTWLPRFNRPKADAIAGKVLMAFLESVGTEDPISGFHVKNRCADDSLTRAIYRWRHEGVNPGLDKAEATVIYFGILFSEFEEWAEDHDQSIWACGSAPSWWTDDSDNRLLDDLDSLDADWRAEARREGTASGVLTQAGHRRVLPQKQEQRERVAVAA
jgi:transposase-like protein